MNMPAPAPPRSNDADDEWSVAFARCADAFPAVDALSTCLARNDRGGMFAASVVMRTRGLIDDVVRRAGGGMSETGLSGLANRIARDPVVAAYCHSLAFEWDRLVAFQRRTGTNPIVPPIVETPPLASDASRLKAVLGRFAQEQRRLSASIQEMPANVFNALCAIVDETQAEIACSGLRHAERATREAVLADALENGALAKARFDPLQVGLSLLVSALSRGSGRPRVEGVIALDRTQLARLIVMARAAGADRRATAKLVTTLHGVFCDPRGLPKRRDARSLLGGSPK